ncbi:MAG: replicative DNA helicase [Burkholderiales bacterium]
MRDDMRSPMYHNESEQSVLGGLMQDNQAIDRIDVTESDFYHADHRAIWKAIIGLLDAGRPADVITVAEALGDELDRVGGLSYIVSLSAETPSAANIRSYAKTVKDRSMLRRLADAGNRIMTLAHEGGEVTEAIGKAQQAVMELDTTTASQEATSLRDSLRAMVERIDRVCSGNESPLKTGFTDLDRKIVGLGAGDMIVVAGRPSMGKAQPLDAKVLLRNGTWRGMGELRLGDELASPDGEPSRVMGVYPQGEKEIFTVTFSDGRHTRACAEHLWRVMYRDWDAPRIIDTSKLSAMLGKARYQNRLSVEMVSGAFGGGDLPLDPYVLGVLLGDGGLKGLTPRLTSADPEILAEVQAILGGEVELRKTGTYDYNLASRSLSGRRVEDGCRLPYPRRYPDVCGDNKHRHFRPRTVYPVRDALNELGLLGKGSESKFIPLAYLSASREDRLSLLQGLMDTDGWAEIHGSVRFSSCSRELSVGVETLVRSLGGTCSIVRKKVYCVSNGERRQGLDAWVCRIRHKNAETFFRLPRKSSRAVRGSNATVCLNVTSIEPSGHEPAQCIAVTHPSRLYVTDDYIVTHNTAFALQIAEHVSEELPVLVFSLEMDAESLAMRQAASVGKVDLMKLRSGQLDDEDWQRLTYATAKLQSRKIFIDDRSGVSMNQIRARARQTKRKHGLGLIVVDYIGLIHGDGDNRVNVVSEISRGLKTMARELGVPVIALSQLNRGVENRTDKRPMMSDLRESGSIEQDADVIMLLYRDEYYNLDSEWKGVAECIIAKQRNGPTGMLPLTFIAEYARFENFSGRYDTQPKKETKRGFQ